MPVEKVESVLPSGIVKSINNVPDWGTIVPGP